MVDGFGSCDLTPEFTDALTDAGVRLRVFDPGSAILGMRVNVLRRMHRKIVVVDGRRAFIGGINYSADHLADFGPEAKQDYAVELQGPIVDEIRRFALAGDRSAIRAAAPAPSRAPPRSRTPAASRPCFVTRDNVATPTTSSATTAPRSAPRAGSVLIANAYFFPGYRLLRDLRRAARRGVDVRLILQGEPDMPIAQTRRAALRPPAARRREDLRVLQAPSARQGRGDRRRLVDGRLEQPRSAQPVAQSRGQRRAARRRLRSHAARAPRRPDPARLPARAGARRRRAGTWWARLRSALVFHFLRHFSRWASALPRHAPKLEMPRPASDGGTTSATMTRRGASQARLDG